MASSPSEHEIQQRIRLACGRGPVRLWRNNPGALVDQQGRFVSFGLCKGSSDLIGLRSLEITPELVGQQLAQFVAVEGVLRRDHIVRGAAVRGWRLTRAAGSRSAGTPSPDSPAAAAPTSVAAPDGRDRASQ
jgi:hypothetical protein